MKVNLTVTPAHPGYQVAWYPLYSGQEELLYDFEGLPVVAWRTEVDNPAVLTPLTVYSKTNEDIIRTLSPEVIGSWGAVVLQMPDERYHVQNFYRSHVCDSLVQLKATLQDIMQSYGLYAEDGGTGPLGAARRHLRSLTKRGRSGVRATLNGQGPPPARQVPPPEAQRLPRLTIRH